MNPIQEFVSRLSAAWRSFKIGPAIVQNTDRTFGHDTERFSPEEYGQFIATSNAVYACATLRAKLLSSRPLRFYKASKAGKPAEVVSGNLAGLIQKVNPFWTLNRLKTMTELCLCLWGKAYWFLERGDSATGTPQEIWWARPDRVRVVPDPQNYISHFLYRPANGGQDIRFERSETVWFRYPNPLDEFEGLSPIAAARVSAEYGTAAMQSNRNLMRNGALMGGYVMPPKGQEFSKETADDLEFDLDRRFRGVDRAHRWAVLRYEAQINNMAMSQRDAEFIKGYNLSLEDVCRAYSVPLDLIGGQRTYANVDAAMSAVWVQCIQPEGQFIADELTEQLLPMFKGEADFALFDYSDLSVLQEDRGKLIEGIIKLAAIGVPLNKLLTEFMPSLLPKEDQGYKWGDVWWAPNSLLPVESAESKPPPPPPAPESKPPQDTEEPPAEDKPPKQGKKSRAHRAIEYGSKEHEALWRAFVKRSDTHVEVLGESCAELFKRQKDSVLARLKQRSKRGDDVVDEPFDKPEWIKKFRVEVRPVIQQAIQDFGESAYAQIGLQPDDFNVSEPAVVRFLEQRAQRFARDVNDTTWNDLKASLAEGIDNGESLQQLMDRVEAVMGERIASSPETIARTEINGAANGGTLLAWKQSDVVESKSWLSHLDNRTRDSHVDAHGQTVDLDEDFQVGDASGPAPGQMGDPAEDCNCRCSMTANVKDRAYVRGNGRVHAYG